MVIGNSNIGKQHKTEITNIRKGAYNNENILIEVIMYIIRIFFTVVNKGTRYLNSFPFFMQKINVINAIRV